VAGYHTVTMQFSLDELRAVVKSLSIGADQLAKKLDRIKYTDLEREILRDYAILSRAKIQFEQELIRVVEQEADDVS
jgi:hypothetical protein